MCNDCKVIPRESVIITKIRLMMDLELYYKLQMKKSKQKKSILSKESRIWKLKLTSENEKLFIR